MTPYIEGLLVFGVVYTLVVSAVHVPLLANHLFFPQVGLMLVSAYGSGALAAEGVPWGAAALVGVVGGVIAAAAIGLLGLRLKDFPLAIATVAVAEALRLTVTSTGVLGGVSGLSGIPKAATWGIALAALALSLLLLAYFHASYASRAAIALGGDEIAARAFGIRPVRVKLSICLLCGLLCGLAGALYASYVRFLTPDFFGFGTLVFVLVFTVVGGSRSMFGPVLGVGLLWLLPEYLRFLEDYRLIAYSLVVIAIIMVQPGGLVALLQAALKRGRQLLDSPSVGAPPLSPVREEKQ